MKKITAILGARPQFIKHAPIDLAAKGKIELKTIHTGQHYDKNMSEVFFDQLKISKPDYILKTGGYSHGKQTGLMMMEIEEILDKEKPAGVLVYGDTNSTLAGALVAAKKHIPVYHVEAGLRSYNKNMPEEINRVLTDHISDILFVTSQKPIENLKKEGITNNVIEVGDVMNDMIRIASKLVKKSETGTPYYYCTLHRPYNVDIEERLEYVLTSLNKLRYKIIFPIHPRTKAKMKDFGLSQNSYPNIEFVEPASYFKNIEYLINSSGLITDSGGMQKEAYWLQKKCITIRTETEWTETLENGWNTLMFDDLTNIQNTFNKNSKIYKPLYGDGNAAFKIVKKLKHIKHNSMNT